MKRYKFLIKPLFFIFSLTASSYMVLVIEKLSPSDFGKHQTLFVNDPKAVVIPAKVEYTVYDYSKQYLRNLCFDYKYGIIDSSTLDDRLASFLYDFGSPQLRPPQIASVNKSDKTILQSKRD